jgi:hypothetical protein
VRHIQAHALLKHNQYIFYVNVKLRSTTGTVEGSDGSFVKQHPIHAYILQTLPF